MKKRLKFIITAFNLMLVVSVMAQTPEGMNYQAVVRDVLGQPLSNQAISVIFEIRQGGPTGTDVYKESQALTTNQFGLFTAEIGAGTLLGGAFNTISWGTNSYYLYVEVDGDPLGSTQLLSVPYALYSKESLNGPTGAQGPPGISIVWLGTFSAPPPTPNINEAYYNSTLGQSLIWDGATWNVLAQDGTAGSFTAGPGISIVAGTISNTGDLDSLNELQTISTSGATAPSIDLSNGGGSISLNGTGGTTISESGNVITINSADSVNDADSDPSNEIQVITSAAGTITLSNGGGSITDLVDDADNDPNNERITTFAMNATNDSLVIVESGVGHAFPLSSLNDGDWAINAGAVYNLTNNVGVGTATPADKLHVLSGAPGTRVRIENSTNGWAGIDAKNTLGEMFVGVQGAFDPNPGEFHIFDNGAGAQRMVIDAAGYLGVNTPNPQYLLDVNGRTNALTSSIGTTNLQWGANLEVNERVNIMSATNTVRLFMGESGSNYIETSWNTALDYGQIFTNNGPLVLNNGAQNVGVGTPNPISKLHVVDDNGNYNTVAHFQSLAANDEVLSISDLRGSSGMGIGVNYHTAGGVSAVTNANHPSWRMELYTLSKRFAIQYRPENTATTAFSEFFSIKETGRVGLGTIAPASDLHINGTQGIQMNVAQAGGAFGGIAFRDGYLTTAKPFHLGIVTYDHSTGGTGFSDGLVISGYDGIAFTTDNSATSNTTLTKVRMMINQNGWVGIGTSTPGYPLEIVANSGYVAMQATANNLPFGYRLFDASYATDYYLLGNPGGSNPGDLSIYNTGGNYPVYINNGNSVGINTNAPNNTLSVNGSANKPGGGSWGVFSDKNIKQNITDYNEGLDLILNVHTVNFQYNNTYFNLFGENKEVREKTYQGVIAQELNLIAPDMVSSSHVIGKDEEGNVREEKTILEVDPSKFTYALINAIKEQQKMIEELKLKQLELENQIESLKK